MQSSVIWSKSLKMSDVPYSLYSCPHFPSGFGHNSYRAELTASWKSSAVTARQRSKAMQWWLRCRKKSCRFPSHAGKPQHLRFGSSHEKRSKNKDMIDSIDMNDPSGCEETMIIIKILRTWNYLDSTDILIYSTYQLERSKQQDPNTRHEQHKHWLLHPQLPGMQGFLFGAVQHVWFGCPTWSSWIWAATPSLKTWRAISGLLLLAACYKATNHTLHVMSCFIFCFIVSSSALLINNFTPSCKAAVIVIASGRTVLLHSWDQTWHARAISIRRWSNVLQHLQG